MPSHRRVYFFGGVAAVIMFGFCFAMVPLYNLICKKTGINTTITSDLITKAEADSISKTTDLSRDITVQLMASNHMGMPWDFYPRTKLVHAHPGEKVKIYFYAKNVTDKPMVAQAIPSMSPPEAISHFHKIECFCFRQQPLAAHEGKDMALVFQIDKDLPKEIRVITLSYTLFDATPFKQRRNKK